MKKNMIKILITLLMCSFIIYIGIQPKGETNPNSAYAVYLNGEKIGLIENKQALLNKINSEQEAIKKKYRAENVYPPVGLEIVKQVTYNGNFSDINEIYNNINEFSIKGYIVTISSKEKNIPNKYLYVLNKEDFNESMQEFIAIFVDKDKYKQFVEDNQTPISDTGEIIENLYIDQNITIKEGLIDTNKQILSSKKEINRYLLYSTLEDSKKYTVKPGDTLESIADNHQLSIEELLIANPDLNGKDSLLSDRGDQVINVSLISPLVDLIVDTELIEKKTASYDTIVKYDKLLPVGRSYVQRQGEDGVARVQFKVQYVNGETLEAKKIKSTELSPPIDKIIVRGGYQPITPDTNDPSDWVRPTVNYCQITSRFGSRWGSFHEAIDISGCGGKDSPIYAAKEGIVISTVTGKRKGDVQGNSIKIDHQNGFVTYYLHLNRVLVNVGDTVKKGQLIGGMGNTGQVRSKSGDGTHLHFGVYYNGRSVNPLNISPAFRY